MSPRLSEVMYLTGRGTFNLESLSPQSVISHYLERDVIKHSTSLNDTRAAHPLASVGSLCPSYIDKRTAYSAVAALASSL